MLNGGNSYDEDEVAVREQPICCLHFDNHVLLAYDRSPLSSTSQYLTQYNHPTKAVNSSAALQFIWGCELYPSGDGCGASISDANSPSLILPPGSLQPDTVRCPDVACLSDLRAQNYCTEMHVPPPKMEAFSTSA